jgi:hypothetical protein
MHINAVLSTRQMESCDGALHGGGSRPSVRTHLAGTDKHLRRLQLGPISRCNEVERRNTITAHPLASHITSTTHGRRRPTEEGQEANKLMQGEKRNSYLRPRRTTRAALLCDCLMVPIPQNYLWDAF